MCMVSTDTLDGHKLKINQKLTVHCENHLEDVLVPDTDGPTMVSMAHFDPPSPRRDGYNHQCVNQATTTTWTPHNNAEIYLLCSVNGPKPRRLYELWERFHDAHSSFYEVFHHMYLWLRTWLPSFIESLITSDRPATSIILELMLLRSVRQILRL
jgi:hypothetical protein